MPITKLIKRENNGIRLGKEVMSTPCKHGASFCRCHWASSILHAWPSGIHDCTVY